MIQVEYNMSFFIMKLHLEYGKFYDKVNGLKKVDAAS